MSGTSAVVEEEVVVTTARPALDPETHRRRQPNYAVIVLNDDDHTFDYVIELLQRVCDHSAERARRLAEEVDRTGRAIVWTGTLEVAELKRDQIRSWGPDPYASRPVEYPLGCVVEPMPG